MNQLLTHKDFVSLNRVNGCIGHAKDCPHPTTFPHWEARAKGNRVVYGLTPQEAVDKLKDILNIGVE